jgi:hypothetical protein
MESAVEQFGRMATELYKCKISHGDLQADNMLLQVQNGVVSYKLIDYDTLTVPPLLGRPITSVGLSSYQHPNRSGSTVTTESDDFFAELVIYLSLLALTEDPILWDRFPSGGRDKELLFEAADFTAASPTSVFRQLYQMGGLVRNLACVLWNFTRCPTIDILVPLERVLKLCTAPPQQAAAVANKNATEFGRTFASKLAAGQSTRSESWLDDSDFQPRKVATRSVTHPIAPSSAPSANKTFAEVLRQLSHSDATTMVSQPVLKQSKAPQRLAITIAAVIGAIIVLNLLVKSVTENIPVTPTPLASPVASPGIQDTVLAEPTPTAIFTSVPQPTTDMRQSAAADAEWQALVQQLRDRAARQTEQPTPSATATYPPATVYETPAVTYRVVNVKPGDYLNVRTGPGVDYPVVMQLSPDTTGILLEAGHYSNGDTIWQEIRSGELTGYVNEIYLGREY